MKKLVIMGLMSIAFISFGKGNNENYNKGGQSYSKILSSYSGKRVENISYNSRLSSYTTLEINEGTISYSDRLSNYTTSDIDITLPSYANIIKSFTKKEKTS